MLLNLRIAVVFQLAALLGCGNTPSTVPSGPAFPNLTGNWQLQIQTTNALPFSLLFNLLGALSTQGSTATGIFHIAATQPSPACPASPQDIPFTGSIDANNLMTLTSTAFFGGVATVQLQLPLSAGGIANGTVKIVGGTCALPSAFVLAVFVPPLSGTYTGTLTPSSLPVGVPATSGTATVTFAQSSAGADGRFPVTANFAYSSGMCTIAATLTGVANGLSLELNSNASFLLGGPSILFSGGLPPTGATSFSPFIVVSNSTTCPNTAYTGRLTQQ